MGWLATEIVRTTTNGGIVTNTQTPAGPTVSTDVTGERVQTSAEVSPERVRTQVTSGSPTTTQVSKEDHAISLRFRVPIRVKDPYTLPA